MAHKILLVDDEPDIIEFLSYNLEKEGFTVFSANSGVEALKQATKHKPDLIVLDVMMPEMDGIETCMEIRKNKNLHDPIIVFLTARSEDYSQIAGLDAGADDYISKPVKPRVFISKIHSLFRRKNDGGKKILNDSEDLIIDKERYIVTYLDADHVLPKKEFELLALLFSRKGKVFTRTEILEKVWGDEVIVGDRTIDVHIRKLREKFGNDLIKTIKGVGYKLDENP